MGLAGKEGEQVTDSDDGRLYFIPDGLHLRDDREREEGVRCSKGRETTRSGVRKRRRRGVGEDKVGWMRWRAHEGTCRSKEQVYEREIIWLIVIIFHLCNVRTHESVTNISF